MLLTGLVFFLILSILVFIHELGHFTVARLIGVHVEEFGFGLPPRIWGKKVGNTVYSVNWLPIGGFVKLSGEDDEEVDKTKMKSLSKKEYFFARSKKERVAILLAGVTMNFLLAWGITTYLLTQGVYQTTGRVHIVKVVPSSPAQQAGLQPNDTIIKVYTPNLESEQAIHVPGDLVQYVKLHAGEHLKFAIGRGNSTLTVDMVPRKVYPPDQGPTGISISDLELHTYPISEAPVEGLKETLTRAKDMLAGIGTLLWRLAQLKPAGADVAGPIGIAQVTGQAVKFGFNAVLEFMSILSLNLAVLNALPIPALDGGRVLFVFLEKILGRRVRPAFERSTHQIGMIILLFLVLLISINDILRIAHGSM